MIVFRCNFWRPLRATTILIAAMLAMPAGYASAQSPPSAINNPASISTPNAIENLMGSVRELGRRVKRWRDARMIVRWTVTAVADEGRVEMNKCRHNAASVLETVDDG